MIPMFTSKPWIQWFSNGPFLEKRALLSVMVLNNKWCIEVGEPFEKVFSCMHSRRSEQNDGPREKGASQGQWHPWIRFKILPEMTSHWYKCQLSNTSRLSIRHIKKVRKVRYLLKIRENIKHANSGQTPWNRKRPFTENYRRCKSGQDDKQKITVKKMFKASASTMGA